MKKKVVVNDKMQHRYVYYRTEPIGRNFAPGFEPQVTPKQMLQRPASRHQDRQTFCFAVR